MSFVPARFIHASNLRLDHQPQGSGPVSESAQQLLEDCTLTAFTNVIQACLDQEVDFLLLTGNSFVETDHSIRARVSLIEGFQKLVAHRIPVLVVPGESDPLSAWDLQYRWPENVTFFSPGDHEPFDILRDEETVATLQLIGSASLKTFHSLKLNQRNQLFNKKNQRPISIGCITPSSGDISHEDEFTQFSSSFQDEFRDDDESNEISVDYLSLSKGTARHTFEMQPGLAHHPGTAQALNFQEQKKIGVTLVNVKPDAPLELRRLKLAPVRWLSIDIQLEPETTATEFILRLKSELTFRKPGKYEQLWMVRWNLTGTGTLLESLFEKQQQARLNSELDQVLPNQLPILLEQTFDPQIAPLQHTLQSSEERSDLNLRYQRQVEAFRTSSDAPLDQLITHAAHLDQTWLKRLHTIAEQLDEQRIFNTAIRNGQTWLNISTDEEMHS